MHRLSTGEATFVHRISTGEASPKPVLCYHSIPRQHEMMEAILIWDSGARLPALIVHVSLRDLKQVDLFEP